MSARKRRQWGQGAIEAAALLLFALWLVMAFGCVVAMVAGEVRR